MKVQATEHLFTGRVAVVTGASRGIGKAIAFELAKHGARLGIFSRRADAIQLTQKQLEELGCEVFSQAFDIADNEQLEKFLQQTSDRFAAPVSILH